MEPVTALIFIAYCAVAFSFAGGVRSALHGGARFNMLKGALFGLAAAMFLGSSYFESKPFLTAGIGAMAAYPGGGFDVLPSNSGAAEKAGSKGGGRSVRPYSFLIRSAVNGALSVGIFCGMFSFYISAAAGRFVILQIVMLLIVAAFFAVGAYAAGRYYKERLEFISDNIITFPTAGVLAALIIFGCFSGDSLMISTTFVGTILGAAAFIASDEINGLLIKTRSADIFGGDILPASIHGIFSGIAVSLSYVICYSALSTRFEALEPDGFNQIGLGAVGGIIATVTIVMLAVDQTQYFILRKWSENQVLSTILGILKRFECLLYCVLPFVISCMGNSLLPEITATGVLLIFVWQLLCKNVFLRSPERYIYVIIILIPILGLMFVRFSTDWKLTSRYLVFIYTVIYEGCALYLDYVDMGKGFLKQGALPRHLLFLIQCALLTAGTFI